MKNIARLAMLTLAVVMASLLPGCKKNETADARDLLATVPSDASMVAVVNIRSIVEKTGSKVDGAKVDPSDQLEELINKSSDSDKAGKAKALLDGASGIDLSCAVVFMEGMDVYAVGNLADASAFRTMIEKQTGEKFRTEMGVETCGNAAVDDHRFWVRLSHRNAIDPSQVKRFTGLDQSQSILGAPGIEALADTPHDMAGWANAGAAINAIDGDFSRKAMARMALGAAFADAQSLSFEADMLDGKMQLSLAVLNSKGKPAKFLYPLEKIDTKALSAFKASGDMAAAGALSRKAVEKLTKESANSVSMMKLYAEMASCIDGTCAVFADDADGYAGFLSTTGSNTATLQQTLQSFDFTTTLDGKQLRFSRNTPAGAITSEAAAKAFKGAVAGFMADGSVMFGPAYGWLGNAVFTATQADGSLKLLLTVESENPKENFLLPLLNHAF